MAYPCQEAHALTWPCAYHRPAAEHPDYALAVRIAERGDWEPKWIRTWVDVVAVVRDKCWFDANAGQDVADFFPNVLRHGKGRRWAGKPFELMDWQRDDLILPLYGWMREDEELGRGIRRFNKAYWEITKKSGKSTLCAGLGLYGLVGEDEEAPAVYTAAGDRTQAGIIHGTSVKMIRQSSDLSEKLEIIDSRKTISYPAKNGTYRALSSDAGLQEGLDWNLVLFDEMHVQKNRVLWDTLVFGGIAQEESLLIVITTAGVFKKTSIGWEQHDYARRVLEGVIEDTTIYPYMRCATQEDDWTDPVVWRKANPSLGVIIREKDLRAQVEEAKVSPAKQNAVLRYRLNLWVSAVGRWLNMRVWDENHALVNEAELEGRECYGGMDLSSNIDLTSFNLVFPPEQEGGEWQVICRFWIPEENIQERVKRDGVPYDLWVKEGLIEVTDGDGVDLRYIRREIASLSERYNVKEIAFDSWHAAMLVQYLQDEGLEMVEFRQGMKSFAPPMKELELLVRQRRLRHGGHKVLRWNADNLAVTVDENNNVRPNKEKSNEKIDGMVALVMALRGAVVPESDVIPIYDGPPVTFI